MEPRLTKFLSYLLHPLLIPTLAVSALLLYPDLYSIVLPFGLKIWFLAIVFLFTFFLPSAAVFVLYKTKVIDSIEIDSRRQRSVPLLVASTSYLALIYSLKLTGIPVVLLFALYMATFALLTGLIINLFYKVSLHTLGWGALTASFIEIAVRTGSVFLWLIIATIVISGLAGYARLKQNAHTPTQVYLGYVAGAMVVMIISFLM